VKSGGQAYPVTTFSTTLTLAKRVALKIGFQPRQTRRRRLHRHDMSLGPTSDAASTLKYRNSRRRRRRHRPTQHIDHQHRDVRFVEAARVVIVEDGFLVKSAASSAKLELHPLVPR